MRYERYASHEVDENERLMKDAKSGSRSRFKNFIKMSMLSTLVKQFPNGDYSAQQCNKELVFLRHILSIARNYF